MEHAITIKDVLIVVGIIGGLLGVGGLCIFLLAFFNPFGSGH